MKPITARVLLIGDAGVGKSSLLTRFVKDRYQDNCCATIGAEFASQFIDTQQPHRNATIKLQMWDIAGAERFRAVAKSYFRGLAGVILAFNLNDVRSLKSLNYWFAEVKAYCKEEPNSLYGPPVIVVGNKSDENEGFYAVTTEEIEAFCEQQEIKHFFRVSAKTGENVHQAFNTLAHCIARLIDRAGESNRSRLQGLVFPEQVASSLQLLNDTSSGTHSNKKSFCCPIF